MKLLAITLALAFAVACSAPNQSSPQNANKEAEPAAASDYDEPAPGFRAALAEFALAQWPRETLKGTTQPAHRLDFWLVALDFAHQQDEPSAGAFVIAREFFSESSKRYWVFSQVSRARYYKELREHRDQTVIPKGDEEENDPLLNRY